MSFYLHIIVASFIFLSCCRGPSHKKAFDRNYPERAFTKVQFMTVKPEFASERLVQGNSGHGKLNLNKFNKGLFLNDSQVDSFLAIINDSSSFSPADLITCTKEAVLLFLDDNNDIVARMELGCSYSVFAFSPPIGPRNYLPLTEKADNQFDSILQSLNQNP